MPDAQRLIGSDHHLGLVDKTVPEHRRRFNPQRIEIRLRMGQLGMSFGICFSEQAPNAFDFTNFAEKALATSKAAGGDTVTIYGASDYVSKDWLLYKKKPDGGFGA